MEPVISCEKLLEEPVGVNNKDVKIKVSELSSNLVVPSSPIAQAVDAKMTFPRNDLNEAVFLRIQNLLESKDKQIMELTNQVTDLTQTQNGILKQMALLAAEVRRLETKTDSATESATPKVRSQPKKRARKARSEQTLEVTRKRDPSKRELVNESSSARSSPKRRSALVNELSPVRAETKRRTTRPRKNSSGGNRNHMNTLSSKATTENAEPRRVVKSERVKATRRKRKKAEIKAVDPEKVARKTIIRFAGNKIPVLAPTDVPENLGLPQSGLKLSKIHGYCGHEQQVRNNLIRRDGKLLYNIAGTVVTHDIATGEQKFFTEHTEDVTSVCIHPTKNLVATGQQDEKGVAEARIIIWDLDTMKIQKIYEGHHHGAVRHLAFSPISGYLYSVAGDDENTIVVFDVDEEKNNGELFRMTCAKTETWGLVIHSNIEGSPEGTIDEFITYGRNPTKTGHLKGWMLSENGRGAPSATEVGTGGHKFHIKGGLVAVKGKKDKHEKSYQSTIALPYMPRVFLVGSSQGNVYAVLDKKKKRKIDVFDVPVACLVATENGFIATSLSGEWSRWEKITNEGRNEFEKIANGSFAHIPFLRRFGAARSLNFDEANNTLYVGSRIGQIFCSQVEENGDGKILVGGHGHQIWGLAAHPTEPYFVTAGYDGLLLCWSCEDNSLVDSKQLKIDGSQFRCACFSHDGSLIAVGTEGSKVFLIDFATFKQIGEAYIPVRTKNAQLEEVGCIAFNPQGNVLAVGHFDSTVYFYDICINEKEILQSWNKDCDVIAACTHVQWSSDGKMLKTFDVGYALDHWDVDYTKKKVVLHTKLVDPDEIQFVGNPIIAGWDVQGVMQKEMDGTDINNCTLTTNSEEKLIACGDDFGKVWLHRYPAIDKNDDCSVAFAGHSAFVVGVAWNHNDSQLISIGGNDRGVFVWDRVNVESGL